MYLIVIEAEGAGDAFHYQPYRLAATVDEAKELMADYLRLAEEEGFMDPTYFALYHEHYKRSGEFARVDFYDPQSLEKVDQAGWMKWLQQTGRI